MSFFFFKLNTLYILFMLITILMYNIINYILNDIYKELTSFMLTINSN